MWPPATYSSSPQAGADAVLQGDGFGFLHDADTVRGRYRLRKFPTFTTRRAPGRSWTQHTARLNNDQDSQGSGAPAEVCDASLLPVILSPSYPRRTHGGRPSVDDVWQTFLRITDRTMTQTSIKTLVAVLLMAAGSAVQANDSQWSRTGKVEKQAQDAPAKKATNRNVGRATAKPFLTVDRPRNAFDVPLLRDARSLPSLTAPGPDPQRWKWSANEVPDAFVRPL